MTDVQQCNAPIPSPPAARSAAPASTPAPARWRSPMPRRSRLWRQTGQAEHIDMQRCGAAACWGFCSQVAGTAVGTRHHAHASHSPGPREARTVALLAQAQHHAVDGGVKAAHDGKRLLVVVGWAGFAVHGQTGLKGRQAPSCLLSKDLEPRTGQGAPWQSPRLQPKMPSTSRHLASF